MVFCDSNHCSNNSGSVNLNANINKVASSRLLLRRARPLALERDFPGGRGAIRRMSRFMEEITYSAWLMLYGWLLDNHPEILGEYSDWRMKELKRLEE